MLSRCRDSRPGRAATLKQLFTTRADFAVDSAAVPVTPQGGHGNVIHELIFVPVFLH
ncbi:hypothetical protein ACVILK_004542 [Bradyrhizobium embrapense]